MKKIRWASVTGKYTGKPYILGETDCFSILVRLLRDIGVHIPGDMEIDGINADNYIELWLKDPARAKEMMTRFAEAIADEVPLGKKHTGCLLLLSVKHQYKNKYPYDFIAIQVGDKIVSSSDAYGVGAFSLSFFNIKKCYVLRDIQTGRSEI